MSAILPEQVKVKILTFPEYKMGAHRVAITMKDGSTIEDVIVAWGFEVLKVGGVDGCPFFAEDAVDAENRRP